MTTNSFAMTEPAHTRQSRGRGAFRSAGAVVVPALVLCGGCSAFQDYHPQPVSAPMQAEALDARTLDDPRLQTFIAATTGAESPANEVPWDLGRLTLAAVYFHPDIGLARSRLGTASAAVITARQIPNPTLSADLGFSPLTISPAISFLIETFGRREYRTEQAQALADAAQQDVTTAAWQVRGRVRTALLNLWAAARRAEYLSQRSSLQDELVQLLERRLAEGEASALDVTRERINRNQFSLALRDAERQSADARAQLATAIGVPVEALGNRMFSLDAFESVQFPTMISELRRQSLSGRADVQALLAQYRGAESAVRLEIAKQYPNVSVGPSFAAEPGTNRYDLSLTAAADLPVFNQNQGPIAEAEAHRRDIATQLLAVQAQAIGAIDAAITSYRTTTASVEAADALLAESRVRNDQVTRSFQAGDTDRPTLVGAGIEVSTAELSRVDAIVQQRQAIGALEDALQRILFEPQAPFVLPAMNSSAAAEMP